MNTNFSKVVTGVNAGFHRPVVSTLGGQKTVKVIYKGRHGAARYATAIQPKVAH